MLRDSKLAIVFLIETKLQGSKITKVRSKHDYPNGIDVDSDGRSGGFSMGLKGDCKASLRSYS